MTCMFGGDFVVIEIVSQQYHRAISSHRAYFPCAPICTIPCIQLFKRLAKWISGATFSDFLGFLEPNSNIFRTVVLPFVVRAW